MTSNLYFYYGISQRRILNLLRLVTFKLKRTVMAANINCNRFIYGFLYLYPISVRWSVYLFREFEFLDPVQYSISLYWNLEQSTFTIPLTWMSFPGIK